MIDFDFTVTCSAKVPYPCLVVEEPNPTYARYMLDNLGGRNSEMTTISFYLHNNFTLEDKVADLYRRINIVEMHHLEIFGKLAEQLGENPLLWSTCARRKVWWSPSFSDYPSGLERVVEGSLQGELSAIEKYEWQISCINDCYIKENLKRIILDEKIHVEIFKELLLCL